MIRKVPYVNLPAQFAEEKDDIVACINQVFESGEFVGGRAIDAFEKAIADYTGAAHAVAVNSGTDALTLAMTALGIGPGDEVITPPNSFIASTAAIVSTGATPVFADVMDDQNISPEAIEAAITPRTKAIMPVHLTGRICDMPAIMGVAEKNGLLVIEDAAQSIGSRLNGQHSGTFGVAGCFSAHPLKNLNAAGDAGFVVTDSEKLAARIRLLRNHGLIDRDTASEWGCVSRMDNIQAAVLLRRLPKTASVIERRRRNVDLYRSRFSDGRIFNPPCRPEEFNSFHAFVVQVDDRDGLRTWLRDAGIDTAIHYPVPLHLQPAAKSLGYSKGDFPVAECQAEKILSLPIHQFLSPDDIDYVATSVIEFLG